jgi:hypothetical protein
MSGSCTSTRTMRVAGSMVIGARGGGLAHDLAVDLAFGGHVDDDVALHGGLAAEAAAIGEAAHAVVAFFDRVPFGQRIGGDGDAMFGKIAVGGCDLAFGADAASPADAVEIDAKLARGRQDRGADGKA